MEQKKEPRQLNGQKYDYISLCLASDAELENVMKTGIQPSLEKIAGWEFKGYNTLDLTAVLGFRKFKKGFYADDPEKTKNEGIAGYNVKIIQNFLGDSWADQKGKDGNSIKHGFYRAYPVRLNEIDNKYPNGVLINYKLGKNFPADPTRLLRDYLVQPYSDNDDLYLGKAYLALGPMRIFVSYFVLERHNKSDLA
jgi:hypothetical protein